MLERRAPLSFDSRREILLPPPRLVIVDMTAAYASADAFARLLV